MDISEPRWGFDGKIRPHRFNLLTVTVDNPSPEPVEFELKLQKMLNLNRIDAPLIEPVFLGPHARRSVQFYPYITSEWGSWRLSWGDDLQDSIDLQQPSYSRRGARVLLESTDTLGNSKGGLRRFPAALFPPSVTATDTLQAAVLDHAPTWDEARRLAFLDWIYRGGTLIILQGANGKFPVFPGTMHLLNAPFDSERYGSGVIRKVPLVREQFTREEARLQWRQLPNRVPPQETLAAELGLSSPNESDDEDEEDEEKQPFGYGDGSGGIAAHSFLDELKKMTRPDHNWLLLHLMFWVYIVLVFPGCFLIGRQRNDFRVVYLTLIGIVVVFSLAFGIVGKRGYGEESTVNSVAIVRPLPDGQLDVSQWSNAFVTSGAMYDIRHQGSGAIYSSCQETEPVSLFIKNGADALFRVDIPPFSSREFAHRIKVPGTLPKIRVESSSADEGGLKELTLAVEGEFPPTDAIYVLYQDRFYSMARQDDRITLRSNVGAVPAFLRVEQYQNYMLSPFGTSDNSKTVEARYMEMLEKLLTRSLDIRSLSDAQAVRWSPDRIRLMYYGDLLPQLAVQSPRLTNQKGKALYCLDVPLSGDEPPE